MINKILIRASDRKILHKDTRTIGMSGENLQEVGVRIDIWTHLMRGCIINYVH